MTAKANPLLDEAIRLHQAGNLDGALALYEQVLTADPRESAALHLKGLVALQRGDAAAARPLMERAVELRDDNAVWWRNLGVCRQSLGLAAEAIAAFRRAHALNPESANVLALAKALLAAGDAAGAVAVLERPSAAPDTSFEMLRLCGYAAALAGNNELALARYQAARRLQPGDSLVLSSLGSLLFRKGEFAKAEEALAEFTRLFPADASGWTARAGVALEANELERAQSCVERALALEPARPSALLARARIVEALGRIDEARAGYERVLAFDPADSNAALALVRIDALALPPATAEALDVLRGNAEAPVRDRARACFTLAQVREKQKDLAGEVALLRQGNALLRAAAGYDCDQDLAFVARERDLIDARRFAALAGQSRQQAAPVFILGMPRAGTTLTEQILAAHSQVCALGESLAGPLALRDVFTARGRPWPDSLASLAVADLEDVAAAWLKHAGGDGRVLTDKAIGNWRYAGLLALAFPRARFIDCRRHPFDNAVGCYKRMFQFGQYYTYDTGELVLMFQAWHASMAHWHALFGERIHVLQYEKLIDDQEGQSRALVDFCGLPWEDACLEFHKAERGVVTASSVQIRQGLNRDAVERWRRYEALFPEFASLMALA